MSLWAPVQTHFPLSVLRLSAALCVSGVRKSSYASGLLCYETNWGLFYFTAEVKYLKNGSVSIR